MKIKTERLTITDLTIEYLEPLHRLLSDREHTRLMVFNPREDIEETKELVLTATRESEKETPAFSEFAVFLGSVFIGNLTLYFFENDRSAAEFAWVISPEFSGKGYAFEAAKALIEYYSANRGVNKFIAQCDSENLASIRLIEKLGMKLTNICGDRYNRSAPDVERTEYTYELVIR